MRMFRVVVNDNEYKVGIEEISEDKASPSPRATPAATAAPKPTAQAQVRETPRQAAAEASSASGSIVAPMPGTVLSIAVSQGDRVSKGQTLLILEAMKMENEIMAPADGTVEVLNVSKGVSVNAGETLIILS